MHLSQYFSLDQQCAFELSQSFPFCFILLLTAGQSQSTQTALIWDEIKLGCTECAPSHDSSSSWAVIQWEGNASHRKVSVWMLDLLQPLLTSAGTFPPANQCQLALHNQLDRKINFWDRSCFNCNEHLNKWVFAEFPILPLCTILQQCNRDKEHKRNYGT